ncbi:unnamed protein product, partial [Prorocentrum cordatum]
HKDGTTIAASGHSISETTSTTVEITALIWAFAYVIYLDHDSITTVSTDSLGALHLATRQAFTDHDIDLVKTLCIFYDIVKDRIELRHVHAREHIPWNELADARDWEFLIEADENTKGACPRLMNDHLHAPKFATTATKEHVHRDADKKQRETVATITFATYNIQAEPSPGARQRHQNLSRLKKVMAATNDDDIHIIGIQESRTVFGLKDSTEAVCASANNYHVIASGHDKFNLGCDLHILTSKSCGRSGDTLLFFRPDNFVVIHERPGILLVKVSATGFQQTICACRAPRARPTSPGEKDSSWDTLSELASKYRISMMMIDANAQTGSITTSAVGPAGLSQQEDDNCTRFHEFLFAHNLSAVNTFQSGGDNRRAWISNASPHRIDYTVIETDMLSCITECPTMYGINSDDILEEGRPSPCPHVDTVPDQHREVYDNRKAG